MRLIKEKFRMRMEHYKVLSSIITRSVKLIKDRHGLYINIDSLPSDDADDAEVYELIKTDKSNDVFGLESVMISGRSSGSRISSDWRQ